MKSKIDDETKIKLCSKRKCILAKFFTCIYSLMPINQYTLNSVFRYMRQWLDMCRFYEIFCILHGEKNNWLLRMISTKILKTNFQIVPKSCLRKIRLFKKYKLDYTFQYTKQWLNIWWISRSINSLLLRPGKGNKPIGFECLIRSDKSAELPRQKAFFIDLTLWNCISKKENVNSNVAKFDVFKLRREGNISSNEKAYIRRRA